MATIGLSKPYFAKYSNSGTTVTYSDGALIGKATEMEINIEESDDNDLYGDNGIAESDKQFAGGDMGITCTDLDPAVLKSILGAIVESITSDDVDTTDPTWLVFNDSQSIPYGGFGGIIKKKVGGAIKWMAYILPKIQFSNPSITAITQADAIEWQTQSLSATIMRSDASDARWFMLSSPLDSEADAVTVIQEFLSIT